MKKLTDEEKLKYIRSKEYPVKPSEKFTFYQYYAAVVHFLLMKMNRWNTIVDHKLMMDKIKNQYKYFFKD